MAPDVAAAHRCGVNQLQHYRLTHLPAHIPRRNPPQPFAGEAPLSEPGFAGEGCLDLHVVFGFFR